MNNSPDTTPILRIPNEELEKTGVTALWTGINNVALYPRRKKHDGVSNIDGSVYLIKNDSLLFDKEVRKLVNESNMTFLSSKNIPPSTNVRLFITDISKEHRSSLRQCIENLQSVSNDEPNSRYQSWIEIFDSIEVVWHLCELLHLDIVPGDLILPKLVEWVRFHIAEFEDVASVILTDSHTKGAELRYPNYWDVVTGLVLQGRFEASRALLRLHSNANTEQFLEADAILLALPIYTLQCGLSVHEFNSRFKGWKSSVRAKINTGVFSSQKHLAEIMSILAGGDSLISLLKKYCDSWYQLLTSSLLFLNPTVKTQDIGDYADRCIAEYGGYESLTLLDQSVLALLQCDLSKFVQSLQLMADGGWSATHLSNLLDICGCFNPTNPFSKRCQENSEVDVESIFLKYAQLLMSHSSLWVIGPSYLKYCPIFGKATLQTLLRGLSITNSLRARKIIEIAREHNLKRTIVDVCSVMIQRCFKQEKPGQALDWALMAEDPELITFVCDKFLLSNDPMVLDPSSFLSLGNSILLSPRLTFLAKYCEIHSLYSKGDLKGAASMLIQLIESNLAPKYFQMTLLLDSLPLFTAQDSLFSSDDCMIILRALEEYYADISDCPKSDFNEFKEKSILIRRMVADSLATTMINEASAPSNERIIRCE